MEESTDKLPVPGVLTCYSYFGQCIRVKKHSFEQPYTKTALAVTTTLKQKTTPCCKSSPLHILTPSHCTSWHCGWDSQRHQWHHTWPRPPTELWRSPRVPDGRPRAAASPHCCSAHSPLSTTVSTGPEWGKDEVIKKNHVTMQFKGHDWSKDWWPIFGPDGNVTVTSLLLSLTWMMAGESCLAAQCIGVSPLRSLMSVRAWLSSSSSFTHAELPRSHARCSGVWPDASRALIWLEAERWRDRTDYFA